MSATLIEADGELEVDDRIEDGAELTSDKVFHILQNERRRMVLKYLQGTNEPVRMRDLAEQVAAWENDTTVEALRSKQRQRVYIPLYQCHLPKLNKAGVIEYQQSRGIVERTPLADHLDPYLDAKDNQEAVLREGEDTDVEWTDYYTGATTIGAFLLLGAYLELPIVAAISSFTIAVVILLMFTSLTVGRYHRQ